MLKVRHQLTTNYFAQRLRAPHGRCQDCARARAEGSTAADSPRHAFGAENRVADVAGSDRSGVYNWSAVADSRSRGCPDCGGGHAGSDRLWETVTIFRGFKLNTLGGLFFAPAFTRERVSALMNSTRFLIQRHQGRP